MHPYVYAGGAAALLLFFALTSGTSRLNIACRGDPLAHAQHVGNRIYVIIVAHAADAAVWRSVRSLLSQATCPERVSIGLWHEQHGSVPLAQRVDEERKLLQSNRVREVAVDLGVNRSRGFLYALQHMLPHGEADEYGGEQWILLAAPGVEWADGWDETMIGTWHRSSGSGKHVLTAAFSAGEGWQPLPSFLRVDGFDRSKFPVLAREPLPETTGAATAITRTPFVGCEMLFGPAPAFTNALPETPLDDAMRGAEVLLSASLWEKGYDMYLMTQPPIVRCECLPESGFPCEREARSHRTHAYMRELLGRTGYAPWAGIDVTEGRGIAAVHAALGLTSDASPAEVLVKYGSKKRQKAAMRTLLAASRDAEDASDPKTKEPEEPIDAEVIHSF